MADDYDDQANEGEQSPYSPPPQPKQETPSGESPYAQPEGADLEAGRRGVDFMGGQATSNGAPTLSYGGGPGKGDPQNDSRSRYVAQFPGGHQMEVVGGGFGGPRGERPGPMPPGGYPMSQMPGQVQLTRAESNQLQRYQNAIADTQQQEAMGAIDPGTARDTLQQLRRWMAPLAKRQAMSALAQAHEQHQQAQTQLGLADGLQNLRDSQLAQAIPNRISKRQLEDGSTVEEFVDQKGMIHPTERQKHLWKLQEVQAQNAAKHDPQEMAAKQADHQRAAEEHERRDYESVYKLLTKKGKDDAGNATETPPSHDDVMAHIRDRDLRLAETKGPQAYAATVLKHYPDAANAPMDVKVKLWKAAHPGQEFRGLSSFQQ